MKRSILLDEHVRAGARLDGDPERPRVLTFGDVPAEYAAGVSACALIDQTDRGLVRATGGERQVFLHRLLANDVLSLEEGRGNRNLLLSSKGKVLHDFDLAVEADAVRLSSAPGAAPALLQALDMYLFTEDVQLADATDEHAPLALTGPTHRAVLAAIAPDVPELPDHAFAVVPHDGGALRVTAVPVAGSPGLRLETDPTRVPALWRALVEAGARPIGHVAGESLRCEAGQAAPGCDVSDDVYPQEARLDTAFSLDKGCYIGQEVVAKIDTYGGLNKRLMALQVAGDDPVPAGTRLSLEENGERRDLGVVTSWAYSFALDSGLVLGYVKRRHQSAGTVFRVGDDGPEATIVRLPLRAGTVPVSEPE